jgi:hypothetical protein
MTDHAEICRINADGTTTYHWENIEAAAQKWQPGCDDLSVYLSKLLLPLRPSREWVGLTEVDPSVEQLDQIIDLLARTHVRISARELLRVWIVAYTRAIEAKLKEKNS